VLTALLVPQALWLCSDMQAQLLDNMDLRQEAR
jgi:hypothetical protein